jgi:hypothetical protein
MKSPQDALRAELIPGVVINFVLSTIAFILIFGFNKPVEVWGEGAFVFDTFPQSFFVAFLSGLIPGLIMMKRKKAGNVPLFETSFKGFPKNVLLRSVLVASLCVVIIALPVAGVLKLLNISMIPWHFAYLSKMIIATVAGLLASYISLRTMMNPDKAD